MRSFQRALRTISLVTLFFFISTSIPLFQLAAYGAESRKVSGLRSEGPTRTTETRPQTTGDRFEKAVDSIRENVIRAGDKADKGEDDTNERETIKAKNGDLDSADGEFRKEFSETEKKLKDAKLPKDILDRHYKFVKHYDDNLKELKANLGSIDQATTKSDRKAKLAKARLHLEKTKKPSKHQKLDPNNLPHRSVKAKERAPRLKKEDFEKDFPPQKSTNSQRIADLQQFHNSTFRNPKSALNHKPILLAFNGSASDMPLQLPRPLWERTEVRGGFDPVANVANDFLPQIAFADSSPLLLAQATNVPTSADLAETPEVQFTPEIRAKALELGNNPVKIYEWVRNNIDYQPYYGLFKGASQTLTEGAGNDFDQASLLIALLRASQIETRYAYGTVEIPIEKVLNWVGGVSDPKIAGMILSSKGIPAKLMTSGGVIKAVQLEHVWVEAWIDYFPSYGAKHKTGQGDTWIPLDPSFKQYIYKQGMDMYALMGFNGDRFLQSYITDTRDITAYQDYGMQLIDYVDTNYPDATIEDVFGASEIRLLKTIVAQKFPFLLGTLPYRVIAKAANFNESPTSKGYLVSIQISGDPTLLPGGLDYTGGLHYLAANRTTLSYDPATVSDQAIIDNYGGNITSVPPYLINVKPVLRVNGVIVATGDSIGLGRDQNIDISFTGPDGDIDRIVNTVTAGAYAAVVVQAQDTPIASSAGQISKLVNLDAASMSVDNVLGQLLFSMGLSYFEKISFESQVFARTLQLTNLRQPSEAMIIHNIKIDYLFGLPRSASEGGISIDVDRNINSVYSSMEDSDRKRSFMILSGLSSSIWERTILEAFFNVPSVSAVRLLKLASEQGNTIYTINDNNIGEITPRLQIDSMVKTDIANAVNAGNNVIVPQNEMIVGQWVGVGYIVINSATGAAGYMISGGLSGGDVDYLPISVREKPEFVADYIRTIAMRNKALIIGRALIGTPYVWGGKINDTFEGLDCSGFVHAAYAGTNLPVGTAENQFHFCEANKWIRQLSERMPGDITWNSGLGHVGIEAGVNEVTWPPNTSTTVKGETIIHASGKPCYTNAKYAPKKTSPNCIFSNCVLLDPQHPEWGGNISCGKFNAVIESPVGYFATTRNESVCRPR